jgi:hypothetical protein
VVTCADAEAAKRKTRTDVRIRTLVMRTTELPAGAT